MKKKPILEKTRQNRVSNFIERIKFLSDSKHYKYIKVSWAAYDSWAAQGQAGGCNICNVAHYNCSFQHKRRTTLKGGKPKEYHWNEFGKICSACFDEIEKQCNYKFIKF